MFALGAHESRLIHVADQVLTNSPEENWLVAQGLLGTVCQTIDGFHTAVQYCERFLLGRWNLSFFLKFDAHLHCNAQRPRLQHS